MPTSARRIALLVLVIAYVWVIESLGFTLTTFIFVFAAIVLLSSLANWKKALIISLSCSIIGYIVFIYFFKTRFPSVRSRTGLRELSSSWAPISVSL